MPLELNKILAVIDPTKQQQFALNRAINVAKSAGASVHAYLCCYSTSETDHFLELKRAEVARHEAWLEKIVAEHRDSSVEIAMQVEWHEDWRKALAAATAASDCDMVIKSASAHSTPGRFLLKTADWEILRNAQCPVLLVKRDSTAPLRRVLIAVNPKVEDAEHQQLNRDIVALGKQLDDGSTEFDLHAVSAYTGNEAFTDPPELAELVGIELGNAHCVPGSPDDVIVDCANLLQSELVIIGTVSRSGLQALTKGNTAERALDRLETDVLIVTAGA